MNNSRFVVKLAINFQPRRGAAFPIQLDSPRRRCTPRSACIGYRDDFEAELLAFGTMGKIGILKSSVAFPT